MAEQDNINLIQKIYTAFGAGDVQTILNNLGTNAEWVNYGPGAIPYAGNFTGRIPAFFQAIGDSSSDGKVAADRFVAQGDNVVAIGRYTATIRKTGARVDTPIAHVFTVRNGKV